MQVEKFHVKWNFCQSKVPASGLLETKKKIGLRSKNQKILIVFVVQKYVFVRT